MLVPGAVRWRNALFAIFFLVGFAFASWVARMPYVRDRLSIPVEQVGLLLLALSGGAIFGFAVATWLIHRFGTHRVTPVTLLVYAAGLMLAGWGVEFGSVPAVVAGLVIGGTCMSITDVTMNTSAAANERALGVPTMPIYHAFYSVGTVAGAGLGAGLEALSIGLGLQSTGVFVILAVAAVVTAKRLAPDAVDVDNPVTMRDRMRVWREPATLLLGVFVIGSTLMEGSANDWLALLMVDGHGYDNVSAAALYAVFLTCMTVGRIGGVFVLARLGRVTTLRISLAMGFVGLATVLLLNTPWLVVVGVVLWGFGIALAFPVAMSAAGDDPRLGPARVATVSAIGYLAMIAGPPVIGALAGFGSLRQAMMILLAFAFVSWLLTPFTREHRTTGGNP